MELITVLEKVIRSTPSIFSLMEIGIYLTGQLHRLKLLKLEFAANRYDAADAGLFGGTNKINREKETTSTGQIMLANMRCMPRLDSRSGGKRSCEYVSGIKRSIELEIRRGNWRT
jgi:hypothetical protein